MIALIFRLLFSIILIPLRWVALFICVILLAIRKPFIIIASILCSGLFTKFFRGLVALHNPSLLDVFVIFLGVIFFIIVFHSILPDRSYSPPEDTQFLPNGTHYSLFSRSSKNKFIWKTNSNKCLVLDSLSQGIYVEGSAGSGKSYSVIEPIIYQAASNGFSGFLYDFKGNPPILSAHMYQALKRKKNKICAYQYYESFYLLTL